MNVFVKEKYIFNNLYFNNTLITTYTIKFPCFYTYTYSRCLEKINEIYLKEALVFEQYCKTVLYNAAVEQYKFSIQNGYPIMIYEGYLAYTITYSQNNMISLYFDRYEYTGGAHGSTVRYSNTWNLNHCCFMSLEDFGLTKEEIVPEIYKQIEEQIQNGTNQYFENYKELVLKTFNPNSFYLSNDSVVIYFQQYDIAPYSSGIVEFKIALQKR